ncbi:DUF3426 domain-containing protein [Desulfovibrio aerotolerans]|uniref:DUF3426 domain-containing protein n=1 Tax=Solidesulfovibrio aerotolerans TaxID=295255 RepID=A0A7C9IKI4_9BACT|nr:DUF3426 domain-containing protein [Solidesulfovibrio aerotolerans]MYL82206.1 DUF3426 domain-containing protein [Solidesulfovibrio aerotolerans]
MIVQCPNCQAKFKLPDGKVGPAGAKLRCGKCRNVFHVEPPAPPEADGLADFDFPDDLAPTPSRAGAAGGGAIMPDDGVPAGLFHSESYDGTATSKKKRDPEPDVEDDFPGAPVKPGFSLDDVADLSLSGGRPSKERRKRLLIIGGVLVFLVVVTLAAVHFLDLWPGRKAAKDAAQTAPAETATPAGEAAKPADKAAAPATPAAPGAQKPEEAAKVKDIMLQNVRQYYVSNEKAGQLFVIEGKAVNNFKAPKEMIKLEASLFDEKGGTLAAKEELAGNTVSLFQLQVMTRDELKNALASQVGVLTNNTNIAPAGEVPFMMVFFDPPEAVKEFGVKVIDVKDPPRQ